MPSRKKKKTKTEGRKRRRLAEVAGILVMVAGALLTLAVISYAPADDAIVRDNTFGEILFPASEEEVANAFGRAGAFLALMLVPGFFGYATVLLTLLTILWGYVLLRHRRPRKLWRITLVALVTMVVGASLLDWAGVVAQADMGAWSGALGAGLSDWARLAFGTWGALVLLLLVEATMLFSLADRDIQRSLDGIEKIGPALRRAAAAAGNAWKERRQKLRDRAALERTAEKRTWEELEPGEASAAEPERTNVNAERPPDGPHPAQATADKPETRPDSGSEPDASVASVTLTVTGQIDEERADDIARDGTDAAVPYTFPSIDLLQVPDADGHVIDYEELEENKQKLLDKLAVYKIEITNINAIVGPTVTLYELTPAPGVKISRIKSLEDDVAMAMAARGIRMIAPIPGKSVVGVEVANRHRELVRLHSILGTAKFRDAKMELPVALGKTIEGEVFLQDLAKMPHLLIAGATGSGKSVGINTLIGGLLYSCHPENLKFVMVDPKKIELQQYRALYEHYLAVPPDGDEAIITEVADALEVLKACEREMECRYNLLSDARVRGIKDYNQYFREGRLNAEKGHKHLPYIVVIVDELADLMMTAGKDIEAPIARLAQMARAIGIHLVLATQRPSVDVITGLIKANFPSRVAFQVASKFDARTILDQNGAERLVGNGDMLYMSGSRLMRLQGPFVSVSEVDALMDYISAQPGPGPYMLPEPEEDANSGSTASGPEPGDDIDELFEEAARIIVRSQQGSVSLLQRKLSVGYTRAARIVDQLEDAGIVGAFVGSKAREVLVPDELALDQLLKN